MKTGIIKLKEIYPFLGENGADPTLEYFLPYNMSEMNWEGKTRPTLLVCPGGGYEFVSQREGEPIAAKFLGYGYNVFVLTYSVINYKFPTQLIEAAAAFDLIKRNAVEWGCDMERTAMAGFSAGGHLTALYANTYNYPEIREHFPESICPKATVLAYPVITADWHYTHRGSILVLTGGTKPTEEQAERLSADKHVTENTPPAYIWLTSDDSGVPVQNSLFYTDALTRAGVPFEMHIYAKGGHGLSTADLTTLDTLDPMHVDVPGWINEAARFLDRAFDGIEKNSVVV